MSAIGRSAARANERVYDALGEGEYVEGAPHLRHPSLRALFRALAGRALAGHAGGRPRSVLDLGAGEGTATLPFLEVGARVTAVDVSARQLEGLRRRAAEFPGHVEVRAGDVELLLDEAAGRGERWDVVAATSFLHHVPDYASLVSRAARLVAPGGAFLSFQDPLRYDTVPRPTRAFGAAAYALWRLGRGDVLAGAARRLRRSAGIYRDDQPEDNAEYHVIRGGVDQHLLARVLAGAGMEVEIVPYFSAQAAAAQRLGERFGLRNTFAVLARRGG